MQSLPLLIWFAVTATGQTPHGSDPHEDPTVQHAPVTRGPGNPQQGETDGSNAPASVKLTPNGSAPEVNSLEAAQDRIMGTWALVPEESHFVPGPLPEDEVRTYIRTKSGLEAWVTTTSADGKVKMKQFLWSPQTREPVMTDSSVLDELKMMPVNELSSEAVLEHAGKVIARQRRDFSADGKVMTITFEDLSSEERPIRLSAVYHKE